MPIAMSRGNFGIHSTDFDSLKGYLLKVKEEIQGVEGENLPKELFVGIIDDLLTEFPLINEDPKDMIILKINR